MWFSLLLVVLLLAVAYFHMIQGLFSALLSTVLALLCAALAFATYESMAANVLAPFKPDYALGLALMGMFILPLFALRLLLDKLVHRACLLPMLLDKGGGLILGVVTAYVIVGMLAIGLQLMPFGNGILGFARVDRTDPAVEREIWLKPDRFAATVASMLSDGVFSGERPFSHDHPDFVTEVGWIEGVLPTSNANRRGVRRYAPPGSITVTEAWEETYVYRKKSGRRNEPPQYEPRKADGGKKFIRVRMRVAKEAQDADKRHRFTLFQTRLVGDRAAGRRAQYHAMAVADSEHVDLSVPPRAIFEVEPVGDTGLLGMLFQPSGGNLADVVFEVASDFQPDFVSYKAGARDDVRLGQAPTGSASAAAPAAPGGGSPPAPTNRVSGVAVSGSHFGDAFPNGITMTDYRAVNVEANNARQALTSGHIHGAVADQNGKRSGSAPLARFDVPRDKRLLHLSVESLRPRSMLGKALNLAVTTMQNYLVTDDAGRQYRPVGAYVIAKFGVTDYIEIQYSPEFADASGRGVRPWSKLKANRLRGDYTYVFLYLVEPGATLVRFTTGGGGARAVDLGDMNLTAPR